jgi:hypothetical protein
MAVKLCTISAFCKKSEFSFIISDKGKVKRKIKINRSWSLLIFFFLLQKKGTLMVCGHCFALGMKKMNI